MLFLNRNLMHQKHSRLLFFTPARAVRKQILNYFPKIGERLTDFCNEESERGLFRPFKNALLYRRTGRGKKL